MMRHVSTLDIPEASRHNLQELGFNYVEDLQSALACSYPLPKAVTTILETFDITAMVHQTELLTSLDLWQTECCHPGIPVFHEGLDRLSKGGLPIGRITELCGAPGSGKTQFCLQLCVDVQIPQTLSGAGKHALYISTDFGFSSDRLHDMAVACMDHCKVLQANDESILLDNFTLQSILDGVHVVRVCGHEDLADTIAGLQDYITSNPIKLLIVDSFSFPFVMEVAETLSRTRLISLMVDQLLTLAVANNLAVVLTNQLTTVVTPDQEKKLIPSLGEGFGHRLHQRILLGNGKMVLTKSIEQPQVVADFVISSQGIR